MHHRLVLVVGLAVLAGIAIGCSSIRSTPLDRLEDSSLIANPTTPLKGIPVTLRVPTHLEITVIERSYGKGDDKSRFGKCGAPVIVVDAAVRETEQVFLLDPQRPASGEQKYGFTYLAKDAGKPGHGYLASMNYKAVDSTIKDSAALAVSALNAIRALQQDTKDQKPDEGTFVDSVVAFRRFNLNSPNFNHELQAFLDAHVNGSAVP